MPTIKHTFEINGEPVDLFSLDMEPVMLSHQFGGGAVLQLRQTADHHIRRIRPGDTVTYRADGVIRFVGTAAGVTKFATGSGDEGAAYTIMDNLAMANGTVRIRGPVMGQSAPTIGEVLADGFEQAGESYGSSITTQLTERSDIRDFSGSLYDLIQEAMRKQPKHRIVIDPSSGVQRFRAVRLYESGNHQQVRWGGPAAIHDDLVGRVQSMDVGETIQGCFTAVEIVQPDFDMTTTEFDRDVELSAGWNESNETTWHVGSLGHATAMEGFIDPQDVANGGAFQGEMMIFRAWELPNSLDDFDSDRPWKFRVRVPKRNRLGLQAELWVSIDAEYLEVNTASTTFGGNETTVTRRYILAKHPVTVAGNVMVPGKAKGPGSAKLIYQSSGTQATFPKSVRVPDAGYEGTAFERYGVQKTKRVETSRNNQVTEDNARRILDAVKNVKHSGRISIYGSVPDWFWNGGNTVHVQGVSETGAPLLVDYENGLVQTGLSVDFADDIYDIHVVDDPALFANTESL